LGIDTSSETMSDEFHRGGFENAITVRGEQTTLRPVEDISPR
jgi:hypothetical protein